MRSTARTLGALFPDAQHGKFHIAESIDTGEMIHISDVVSGLACGCRCPGCGRAMVAHKGRDKAHHFQHEAERHDPACASAGETVLHKLAKQFLADTLRLHLPELVVNEGDLSQTVIRSRNETFEKAELEKRDGSIVPDVLLWLKGYSLAVEFKVAHACGPDKLKWLRDNDRSAIEIDLSAYRNTPLEDLGTAILFEAPRRWLHNRKERAARIELRNRITARVAERSELIARLNVRYRESASRNNDKAGHYEQWARTLGLDDLVNRDVRGSGCFVVPPAEWQALVIRTLVLSWQAQEPDDLLRKLRKEQFVDEEFERAEQPIIDALKALNERFDRPLEAIRIYLHLLKADDWVKQRESGWTAAKHLSARARPVRSARLRC